MLSVPKGECVERDD